ncbi:MAG: DNA methyltransferase, partial [Staphylococcus sp.]|nr:DNA methyltransferase [Staphylococcus sp.]
MNKHVQYQSTISKSNSKIIERVFNLRKELENIENKIPTVIQQQFNFKGRKSPIIGSKIINSLTDSNAKVLDPFLGSGSYIISACENDRKFYGVELDNYTYDIVKTYYSITNLDNLEKIFNNIKNKYYDEIRDLYKTKCCNTTNYIKKLHFDPIDKNYYSPQSHRDIKNRKNIKLLYTCPICGNKDKQFDDFDISKLKEIEKMNVSDFPSHTLIENSRINITKKTGADKYDRNFTKRSKIALLKIQKAISSLPASHEKNLLQHFLVASLTLSRIAQYGSGSEYIYQVMNY